MPPPLFSPKTDYICDPWCEIVKGRRENTEKMKHIRSCEDRRGNTAEVAHSFSFASININSFIIIMKRE
jgi:hypothetical protein